MKRELKLKKTPKAKKELLMKTSKKIQVKPEKSINPYWIGGKFLEYCVKQKWLSKDGAGTKGIRWYPTEEGKKMLKTKYGIKI